MPKRTCPRHSKYYPGCKYCADDYVAEVKYQLERMDEEAKYPSQDEIDLMNLGVTDV